MQWHEKNGTNLLKWPGNSPDMNPIENLWAILKQKIRLLKPKTKEALIRAIIKVWFYQIPEITLKNLVDSMPHRIEAKLVTQSIRMMQKLFILYKL